jgi:hypothetical protein
MAVPGETAADRKRREPWRWLVLLAVVVAALSFTFPGGLTAAAGGVLLFAAEIYLQVSMDSQISQGDLASQGSEAHILLFVVTVLLAIWAIATAANARQFTE